MTTNNATNKTSDTYTCTTSLITPVIDRATTGTITIGNGTATAITLGANTTVNNTLYCYDIDRPSPGQLDISGTIATSLSVGPPTTFHNPVDFLLGLSGTLTGHASLDLPLAGGTLTGALTIATATGQLLLGNGNTTTITAPAPSANRTYTLSDFGGAATFVLTNNTTTSMTTNTYTPVISDGTHVFTTGTAFGFYSVIGDTVLFSTNIAWSSLNSATGQCQVSLPLTAKSSTSNYRGAAFISYSSGVAWTSGNVIYAGIGDGATAATLLQASPTGSAPTAVNCSGFSATGGIQLWGYYRTA